MKGVVFSPNHDHFKYAFSFDVNKANGMKMFFRQNCNYQGYACFLTNTFTLLCPPCARVTLLPSPPCALARLS